MKKLIIGSIILILLGCGVWFGYPAYKNWVARRSLEQAQDHFAKAEYRQASLCARKVLSVRPANVEATRIMAQLAELAKSPAAIKWRQRVVELEPDVAQNHLDLAASALAQKNPKLARAALEGMTAEDRNTTKFHQLAALIAMTTRHFAEAEAHFLAATRLEPTNAAMRLNLAVLRSHSTNATIAQAAEKTLENLSTNQSIGRKALRQLTLLAQQRSDLLRAQRFSEQLQADPAASFDDRILHLTILSQADTNAAVDYLAKLQHAAEQKPEHVFALATWMIGKKQAKAALQWITKLPEEKRRQQPVIMALADCYSTLEDWGSLQRLLKDEEWESLEFMRLAILAHASGEQNHDMARRSQWKSAVKAATPSLKALQALLRMSAAWKWDAEHEDLLWLVVQKFPSQRWALQNLEKRYFLTGNTRGLQRLYAEQVSFNLKDLAAKNNLATTSMLLGTQLTRAHEMAQQVYAADPKQPAFVSTYAFSQHLQGNTRAGLKALQTLKPEMLEAPSVAVYYGVLLAAAGETNQARRFLDIAEKARLLPEEKALVDQARKSLQ